jgi:alpha-tubulin suppressor-like RCC1 family protein
MMAVSACSPGNSDASPSATGVTPPAPGVLRTGTPGELWSAGLDAAGQLGRPAGRSAVELAPVQATAGKQVVAVAAGGQHSLAVLTDGTVMAWGANDHGQLGHGRPGTATAPGLVVAPGGAPGVLRDVVDVQADTDFSMALRSDGTVVTWGTGDAGQRGNGQEAAPAYPTQVLAPGGRGPLTGVKQITADGRTELALLNDGHVVAWGVNTYGMLGDGTLTSSSVPVYVVSEQGTGELAGIQQVAVGGQNGLALKADGTVVAWGHNDLGQLGDGTQKDRLIPGPVLGPGDSGVLSGVVGISAAEKHALAVMQNGTVLAWGNNTAGQLGDGGVELSTAPVPVAGSGSGPQLRGVVSVDAGEAYGVAVLDDGSVRTWGANGRGQLGSGDRISRDRPGPVAARAGTSLSRVVAVAAGERHLLVVTAA